MMSVLKTAARQMAVITAAATMTYSVASTPADAQTNKSADAQNWAFTFASGSVGGTFNTVVTAVAEKLKADYPGTNVDIIPGGSVSNAIRLGRGDFPVAMITALMAKQSYEGKGTEQFEQEGPQEDICGVAAIYNQHFQFVAPADFPASTIGEVIEEEMDITIVPGGPRGHIGVAAMQDFLREVHGITLGDMESWGADVVYAEFGDTTTMLRDGQVDLFTPLTAAPNGSILDLVSSRPMKFLEMDEEAVQKMEKLGYVAAEMPAETYPGQEEPISTISAPAAFYARCDADEDLVEAIVEILIKYEEQLKNVHVRLAKDFDAQTAHKGLGVPLHEGAKKAYQEAGIIQ